jgi:hypothetical protein
LWREEFQRAAKPAILTSNKKGNLYRLIVPMFGAAKPSAKRNGIARASVISTEDFQAFFPEASKKKIDT